MNENILESRDLHYKYPDGTHALKGISLQVKRGQTTAVLGGNGAGKSTLFLSFNGILKPSGGKIFFDGRQLDYSHKGLLALRSRVGIVFQDPDSQLFSASVVQDVSFGVMNMKFPEQQVREKVAAAMTRTGITHLKDKPTHCLSFGQKKRVAIAGVLAMEPDVLILDEPTAGLDPLGVSEVMKLLKQTQQTLGITVIIATHDIDMVPLYCDHAYVMHEGEMIMVGTPKDIFARKDVLRKVNLRLPRIGHLMEILEDKDDFHFNDQATTIKEARRVIKAWRTDRQ